VLVAAARADTSTVALRVAVDNPAARALYAGLGFVPRV
jgi:predicted GNAT family acetyltransferase